MHTREEIMQETVAQVKPRSISAAEFKDQDPEFQDAILNLINVHIVS